MSRLKDPISISAEPCPHAQTRALIGRHKISQSSRKPLQIWLVRGRGAKNMQRVATVMAIKLLGAVPLRPAILFPLRLQRVAVFEALLLSPRVFGST